MDGKNSDNNSQIPRITSPAPKIFRTFDTELLFTLLLCDDMMDNVVGITLFLFERN